jgi:signal transduction histidine kinase
MRPPRVWQMLNTPLLGVVVLVVCAGLLVEAWLGYRATAEWQTSSSLLVARRAKDSIDVLMTALSRDMGGVQTTVLSSRDWNARSFTRPYEARALVAGAFARYPYPESFFGWGAASGHSPIIFIRANRPPPWLTPPIPTERYPVEIVDEPQLGQRLLDALEHDIRARRLIAAFELDIAGERYQIVSRLNYASGSAGAIESAFGFMVNLERARQEYFAGILRQVARLTDTDTGLNYSLVDDKGRYVVRTGQVDGGGALLRRELPILFLDPRQVTLRSTVSPRPLVWTVQVSPAPDDTLMAAAQGARWIRSVIATATLATVLGLIVAVRVTRASVELASMRSDFVSSVTHELKTPLTTILGVSETLFRGRVTTGDGLNRYAQLLMQESRRLIRLVDNILAYARVTDVTEVYSFQPLEPAELVAAALRGFPDLKTTTTLEIEVPSSLPTIRADRTSVVLTLDNLIDNALRYSSGERWLAIRGRACDRWVAIAIEDHGAGIPESELPLITRRFVRGRSTDVPGSGLGLAIVTRVMRDHGGEMRIDSVPGRGTTVTLQFPMSAD